MQYLLHDLHAYVVKPVVLESSKVLELEIVGYLEARVSLLNPLSLRPTWGMRISQLPSTPPTF